MMAHDPRMVQKLLENLAAEAANYKGLLGVALKQSGGTINVEKENFDLVMPFEITMRRNEEDTHVELRVLEGKEEIESVLGKPSALIVPK